MKSKFQVSDFPGMPGHVKNKFNQINRGEIPFQPKMAAIAKIDKLCHNS